MSKSAILKSSLAKKYWMAATGLFLCTFLIGHLLGNLQLLMSGEDGKVAFNQYAYFMTHNIFIKVLSYLTYISILFHAIDGFALTIQNKKARPVNYAYNKPSANSSLPSRYMAILGTLILVFISTHMVNFWWKMKYASDPMPLHAVHIKAPGSTEEQKLYLTHNNTYIPAALFEDKPEAPAELIVKNGTEIYNKEYNLKQAEGYKDLHSVVAAFFGQDKVKDGAGEANKYALVAVLFYVLSMAVLAFHLWHGFASAFQTMGVNHKNWNGAIRFIGRSFAIVVPFLFAVIPVYIYLTR
ncbi:MAG: succinate dehydrogenase cytochrome b subunit [Bacteroidota bacterium]